MLPHLNVPDLKLYGPVVIHPFGVLAATAIMVGFFLGKRRAENDIYGADDRGYHASSPFVFGEALRRKAVVMLGEIGVPVKYAHSEVGYIEATEEDGKGEDLQDEDAEGVFGLGGQFGLIDA